MIFVVWCTKSSVLYGPRYIFIKIYHHKAGASTCHSDIEANLFTFACFLLYTKKFKHAGFLTCFVIYMHTYTLYVCIYIVYIHIIFKEFSTCMHHASIKFTSHLSPSQFHLLFFNVFRACLQTQEPWLIHWSTVELPGHISTNKTAFPSHRGHQWSITPHLGGVFTSPSFIHSGMFNWFDLVQVLCKQA